MDTNADSNAQPAVPQRGALLVTVTPATAVLSAGSDFSIHVRVANPFDVPISIKSITTRLPVDLYDVQVMRVVREREKVQREVDQLRKKLIEKMGGQVVPTSYVKEGALRPLFRAAADAARIGPLGDVMADAASIGVARVAQVEWSQPIVNQIADAAAHLLEQPKVETTAAVSPQEINRKVADLIAPLEETVRRNLEQVPIQERHLQPGNSDTWVFTLRTRFGVRFRPASYSQDIAIEYEVDERTHFQSIPYSLDIQASLVSVILGAVVGAVAGVVANKPNLPGWDISIVAAFISAILLSMFAVIAFARKEGVQPIVAIQDLWGGLLVGFLVGYSGVQVLGNLFGAPAETPAAMGILRHL